MGAGGIGNIVGGVVQMFTAMDEANAEGRANNAQYLRERAQAQAALEGALEKGSFEEQKVRLQGAQMQAKQKSAYIASGVDATSGTAAAVQADSAAMNELDARNVKINAYRDAWGYREAKKQAGEEYEARAANIKRKETAGIIGGFTKYGSGVLGSGFGG